MSTPPSQHRKRQKRRSVARVKVQVGKEKGLKTLLAAAPLEDIELERSKDGGRASGHHWPEN